jgi:hypothetical protein
MHTLGLRAEGKMRELWDRYGPWLMIAFVAIGFLRVVWGRDAFCGPETEQCFREWVSALGGWAAVGAAVPTIYFLSKQLRDMREQHNHERWSQRSSRVALCKAATNICDEIDIHIETMKEALHKGTKVEDLFLIGSFLDGLKELFEREALHRFEIEIGPPKTLGAKFMTGATSTRIKVCGFIQPNEESISRELDKLIADIDRFLVPAAYEYMSRLKSMARAFEDETASILVDARD